MRFFIFIILIQTASKAKADCEPRVMMFCPNRTCLGKNFNLTCNFVCLSANITVEVLKNEEVRVSSSYPVSKYNISVLMMFHIATESDSGRYRCKTNPAFTTSPNCRINIIDCPDFANSSEVMTRDVQPTSDLPFPWNMQKALMWYLLCKTGFFLMFLMSAVLKSTCQKY